MGVKSSSLTHFSKRSFPDCSEYMEVIEVHCMRERKRNMGEGGAEMGGVRGTNESYNNNRYLHLGDEVRGQ